MLYLDKEKSREEVQELSKADTDVTVYREIATRNEARMDEMALMFLGKKISFNQLFEQADRIADILAYMGVKSGDSVLICINGTPQSASLLLACSKMGVCAMMLTPRTTDEMVAHVVDDCHGQYLFCMTQFYPIFAGMEAVERIKKIIIMPDDKTIGDDLEQKSKRSVMPKIIHWAEFLALETTEHAKEVIGGDYPLAICFTTGSTGIPKGILFSNRSYIVLEKIVNEIGWDWKEGDLLFSIVPTFVATGISLVLLVPLMLGVAILQEPRLNPFETFIFNLVTYRPSIVFATKSIWMSMAESLTDSYDLSAIKHVLTVGETISQVEMDTVNAFLGRNGVQVKLENMYGMSECNSLVTYHSDKQTSQVSAGMSVPYAKLAIFDTESGKELKNNEIGELYFQIPSSMQEYFMNEKATNEFYVMDDEGNRWGKTGDIAYIKENGEVVICCRAKEKFTNENGDSIYPFMIENEIKEDKNIRRCKVIATTYNNAPALACHITLQQEVPDPEAYVAKVQEKCKACGDISILPTLYKIRDTFPISQAGKIDMIAMSGETDGYIVP